MENENYSIAAIIPCYNEELTIAKVIHDVRAVLPEAEIYVFDNNSSDNTAEIASSQGAKIVREKRQGKGYVVRAMFEKVDADCYIMIDGDDTYDVANLRRFVDILKSDDADMILGCRLSTYTKKAFRPFHFMGNRLVRFLVNKLFRVKGLLRPEIADVMSGLRVMSRAFVKNINLTSSGFEVETEMIIKAIKYGFVIREEEVAYRERPEGSESKLRTVSDGILVLKTILIIFRDYKPLVFFSFLAFCFLFISILSGSVVVTEFIETHYIRRVPLAIFASGSMILSIVIFVTGIILDSINRRFDELNNLIKTKCGRDN